MNKTTSGLSNFSISGLCLALLCTFLLAVPAFGASSADGMWSDVAQRHIVVRGTRATIPDRYRTSRVDLTKLQALLEQAPAESSDGAGVLLTLPFPDGSYHQFLVKNSQIMAPALAKRNPNISTYIAEAYDESGMMGRLDLTPSGFHAMIFTVEGSVYIDPYQTGSNIDYISYYRRAFNKNRESYYCAVTGEKVAAAHSSPQHERDQRGRLTHELRTYRLAMANTGEYANFHGGTADGVIAAMTTTINRVNAIYERELAVRLLFSFAAVFLDPNTDPYSNTDSIALLNENQTTLDSMIGAANYDIGHVLGTGGGGLAGLGVVCSSAKKAHGETGSATPVGDPFDVDLVAHEIAHQFGGNHTINGITNNCGGSRKNLSAYEWGSGSTIAAYAGNCGAENLQTIGDDVFHTPSLIEMTDFINGAGGCSINAVTGNSIPLVDAGAGFVVPANTPLLLIAASVSDPDAGQVLTYSWEQWDPGATSVPNSESGNRPMFRSFPPHSTSVRFLPQMSDILAGTATMEASLPSTNRSLPFGLTVRDNAAGGGGVDYDSVVHKVATTAGPFTVTSQATPQSWGAGSRQTVTWNVAGTDAAPVNCATVQIIYSESEFKDFSGTTLEISTPNDGSVDIIAPTVAGTRGRIMVKCNSNIFFDINDAPITITAGACGNSILDGGETCDDGNASAGDGCSASCQVEDGYSCTAPIPPVVGTNALPEGGFEGGTPNPVWAEFSSNFGTPLCDSVCGILGANTGNWWVWFGGIAIMESGSVEQNFVIETNDTEISFARRIADCDDPSDFIRLNIDGTEIWFADGAHPDCGQEVYTTETINLAGAIGGPYNDGLSHQIRFESAIFANNNSASNFFIDDASILRGGSPAIPSLCTLLSPDTDGDGVFDSVDNCTNVANADQRDTNGDGHGNRCDFDYTNNCVVNFLDLGQFGNAFGSVTGDANFNEDVDLDGNGIINFIDFGAAPNNFAAAFSNPPGPSANECVPQ